MANKKILIIVIIFLVASLLIKVPFEEDPLFIKYFDKEGNEIRVPLAITGIEPEFAKIFVSIKNEQALPIECKISEITPRIDFSDELIKIEVGQTGILESALILKEDIGNTFNVRVNCFVKQNGRTTKLPDRLEVVTI